MATLPLSEFIDLYRDDLIRRCQSKVAMRTVRSPATTTQRENGVPLFLDQLVNQLRRGESYTHEIEQGAAEHGRDLMLRGFTVSQVVHDYGDVCQAITDLALEMDAPIETNDFRILNQCLDDAIASAVTEHARGELVEGRDGEADELAILAEAAIIAFDTLQAGRVGVAGTTARVLRRTLVSLRALADRQKARLPGSK